MIFYFFIIKLVLKTEIIFLSQVIHDLPSGTLKKTKKLTKKS